MIPDSGRDTARTEDGWGWTFIDLAALGINNRRSYFVALLRIVFYPLAFSLATFTLVVAWAVFVTHRLLPLPPPIAVVVAVFGSEIAMGIAVLRSVTRTHRRPWLSLVSAPLTLDWKRLAIGAGVQAILAILTSAFLLLMHLVTVQPWRLAATLPVLTLALLLTPLQAASEEILFRGYLTQAFGRIFRSRTKIVVAVGMTFAVLHFNAYGALTIPYMFGFSLILSLATLRDDRIELAIGAHTAQNWLGVVVSIDSLVDGGTEIQITWPYLLAIVLHGILFYGLTRLLVRLACDRRASLA
jgi:membrane protease YdiL (CAAX protease family)